MVAKERNCCQRFRFGLHHDIQLYLVTHDTSNFDELMDKTKSIEDIKTPLSDKQAFGWGKKEIATCEALEKGLTKVLDLTSHIEKTAMTKGRIHTSLRAGYTASSMKENIWGTTARELKVVLSVLLAKTIQNIKRVRKLKLRPPIQVWVGLRGWGWGKSGVTRPVGLWTLAHTIATQKEEFGGLG